MTYAYIAVMALVTYLIRMLPLTLFQKKIKNKYIRSFLYYVPYACLTAMTFPTVLDSTSSIISAAAGFLVSVLLALKEKSLLTVAISACGAVFVVERILALIAGQPFFS